MAVRAVLSERSQAGSDVAALQAKLIAAEAKVADLETKLKSSQIMLGKEMERRQECQQQVGCCAGSSGSDLNRNIHAHCPLWAGVVEYAHRFLCVS